MAKSSRSTARKTNNKALKARVFGPVEAARAERLSQKLLEIAQQPAPAPAKSDMEVEKDGECLQSLLQTNTDTGADATASDAQQKPAADQAEGSSMCFSLPVPPSLLHNRKDNKAAAVDEELFYHLLGLSGDIAGFTTQGDLGLLF